MREVKRQGKTFVQVDGEDFEYDGVVKIYINSATGNWVVNTNLPLESVVDVLSDAQDHFVTAIEDVSKIVENENGMIGETSMYPLKDPDYN